MGSYLSMTTEEKRQARAQYMREYLADPVRRAKANANRARRRLENPDHFRQQDAARRVRDREKILARKKKYREVYADKIREYNTAYNAMNPEIMRQSKQKYAKTNPDVRVRLKLKRRLAERQAMPVWADRVRIRAIYQRCRALAEKTGQEWHVDHIVPLRGKTVCGLHVAENLQILPALANTRKSNKFEWGPA